MKPAEAAEDIRIWILAGVILAFAIGPMGEVTSGLLMAVLVVMMSLSMEGLTFSKKDTSAESKGIVLSMVSCFVIGTGTALAVGLFFAGQYPDIWKGWVMLAAVPSAVSVVTAALYMKGDLKLSVLSTAAIYILALALTPLLTMLLIGDAVSPLQILKYVLLFVAVPMLMTFPLKKLHIGRRVKVVSINFLMFLMVVISVGLKRDFFFSEPTMVFWIVVACAVRTFGVSIVMMYAMRRRGVRRDSAFVYMPMAVWKNSGLATTLCILLLSGSPGAVLPCVISMLVEVVWFAAMKDYFMRKWPADAENGDAATS